MVQEKVTPQFKASFVYTSIDRSHTPHRHLQCCFTIVMLVHVYIKQFTIYRTFLGSCLFLLYMMCVFWIFVIRNHFAAVGESKVKGYNTDTSLSSQPGTPGGSPSLQKQILRQGILPHRQHLRGSVFDSRGVYRNITAELTSTLLFSFSPDAEQLFARKLVDPKHEQLIFANSPAMIWHDGKFTVVMRMWLDKERNESAAQNTFSDNYFYMRMFTERMEPLDKTGRLLGIPTRVHEAVGKVLSLSRKSGGCQVACSPRQDSGLSQSYS